MLFAVYKGERSPNRCDVVASGVGDHEFVKCWDMHAVIRLHLKSLYIDGNQPHVVV